MQNSSKLGINNHCDNINANIYNTTKIEMTTDEFPEDNTVLNTWTLTYHLFIWLHETSLIVTLITQESPNCVQHYSVLWKQWLSPVFAAFFCNVLSVLAVCIWFCYECLSSMCCGCSVLSVCHVLSYAVLYWALLVFAALTSWRWGVGGMNISPWILTHHFCLHINYTGQSALKYLCFCYMYMVPKSTIFPCSGGCPG